MGVLLISTAMGCGNVPPEPPADTRCERACADDEMGCEEGAAACELGCNALIEGLSTSCSGCLLEGAARSGVVCLPGELCCAGAAEYPNGVLDCETSCAGDVGAPVRDPDARCDALCGAIDVSECGSVRAECYADCQARIEGSAGLCANCLLEGAGAPASVCLPGEVCCPGGLEFASSVEACAAICAR